MARKRYTTEQIISLLREAEVRVLDEQGRKGEGLLTEAERTGLMSIAVRRSLFWTFLYVVNMLSVEGWHLWALGTWSENASLNLLLAPPVVFFGVFWYLRRKYLDRVDAMWQREFDLEVQRRMSTEGPPVFPGDYSMEKPAETGRLNSVGNRQKSEERAKIIANYGAFLERNPAGPDQIWDVKCLPYDKETILDAICLEIVRENDGNKVEALKSSALWLADYQEGMVNSQEIFEDGPIL